MKRYKIFGLITLMVLMFSACETDVEDPAGIRGEGLVGVISDVDPAIYVSGNLDESFTTFTVDVEEGAVFDEAYIVASYNGVSERERIKDVTSFPSEITITAEEAASALGMSIDDVESQDYFVFELVTVSGGVITRSNAGLTVRVVCPYDPDLAFGSYTAASSGWAVNGGITIEADEEDPYTIYVYGLAEIDGLTGDVGPVTMHINPLNFKVVADKSVIASLVTWGAPYHNIAYEGSGEFNSCTGDYTMLFAISVDEGNFGSYEFTFTRN